MSAPTMPAWMEDAVCAQIDPEMFFPDKGEHSSAKKVCADCPVRAACLDYAVDQERTGEPLYGIWGGLTAAERRRLRGGRKCRYCDSPVSVGRAMVLCDEHRLLRRRESKALYERKQRRLWANPQAGLGIPVDGGTTTWATRETIGAQVKTAPGGALTPESQGLAAATEERD